MKQLTPLKSIRHFCLDCMGFSSLLVRCCPSKDCEFHHFRFGTNPYPHPKLNPVKSIRFHCLKCVGSSDEVKKCTTPECSVYFYRFGKNPHKKGHINKAFINAGKKTRFTGGQTSLFHP